MPMHELMDPIFRDPHPAVRRPAPAGRTRAWTVALVCVWLAGCAGGNSVKGGSRSTHTYDRVLIVGLSSDYNQRCAFEFSLMSQLNANTPIAGASCDFMTQQDPLTRANIQKVVATTKADAVISTRTIDAQYKAVQGATLDEKGGAAYKPDDIYTATFDDGHGVVVGIGEIQQYPPITTIQGTIELYTRVYDTSSGTMIDSFQTKVGGIASETDFLLDVTPGIASHLRRDGIIR